MVENKSLNPLDQCLIYLNGFLENISFENDCSGSIFVSSK